MGKWQILIIGNDMEFYHLFQDSMAQADISICTVNWPMETLSSLCGRNIVCILWICRLLDTEYLKAIQVIRKKCSNPILVLLPSFSAEEKSMLFQSGANKCLERPTDVNICAAEAYAMIQG